MFQEKHALMIYTNPNICEYFFNKYLNWKIYENTVNEDKRVYDNLGLIDTLGYDQDRGCNHFSHSDEGGSLFGIKFLNKWYVYTNYDKIVVYVFDGNYFNKPKF